MKKYLIITLCAVLSNLFGQKTNEFQYQNLYQINSLKSVIIGKNKFILNDKSLDYSKLYYSEKGKGNKKLIDKVEYSPYKSTLYSFKIKDNNSYVIFWETEYEYYPIVKAYYIINDRLYRIGDLMISSPCKTCESFEYPIKKIKVSKKGKEIQISFLEDVNCKLKATGTWNLFKKETIKYLFNTKTNSINIEVKD